MGVFLAFHDVGFFWFFFFIVVGDGAYAVFTEQPQSWCPPRTAPKPGRRGLPCPAAPFLPPRKGGGNAKWWKKPEPLFRKVKRGAVLARLLSHAYSIRPGPGPYGKEEGDPSPLFLTFLSRPGCI